MRRFHRPPFLVTLTKSYVVVHKRCPCSNNCNFFVSLNLYEPSAGRLAIEYYSRTISALFNLSATARRYRRIGVPSHGLLLDETNSDHSFSLNRLLFRGFGTG